MSFRWTTVWVEDLERSVKFYQHVVGLKVERKFVSDEHKEIAFLGSGSKSDSGREKPETKLELIEDASKEKVEHRGLVSLGFEVDSLEEKMNSLQVQGIEVVDGPHQPNPHLKFFFIEDPDGLLVQFVEELD